MGPRLREDKRGHPHPFDKLRAGSNLPPFMGEGVLRRVGYEAALRSGFGYGFL